VTRCEEHDADHDGSREQDQAARADAAHNNRRRHFGLVAGPAPRPAAPVGFRSVHRGCARRLGWLSPKTVCAWVNRYVYTPAGLEQTRAWSGWLRPFARSGARKRRLAIHWPSLPVCRVTKSRGRPSSQRGYEAVRACACAFCVRGPDPGCGDLLYLLGRKPCPGSGPRTLAERRRRRAVTRPRLSSGTAVPFRGTLRLQTCSVLPKGTTRYRSRSVCPPSTDATSNRPGVARGARPGSTKGPSSSSYPLSLRARRQTGRRTIDYRQEQFEHGTPDMARAPLQEPFLGVHGKTASAGSSGRVV
jgi:hypothetical protein